MNNQFVYCRVSTGSQDTTNQIVNLKRLYPHATFVEETASGIKARPALEKLVRELKRGDELIVSSLDRLGRKTSEILVLIEGLERRGIVLKSLREGVDYSTISGRLLIQILASVSELERSLISQRTKAALAAKKEKGIVGGRPKKFGLPVVDLVRELREQGLTLAQIADRTKMSKTRVHQLLKK